MMVFSICLDYIFISKQFKTSKPFCECTVIFFFTCITIQDLLNNIVHITDLSSIYQGDLRKHIAICEKKEAKVKAKEVTLHICESCNKEFASPYNLRRHQLTHTDEKPYQVCSRTLHIVYQPFCFHLKHGASQYLEFEGSTCQSSLFSKHFIS